MRNSDTLDAIILGGGPAGLQAALTLGRMRYSVVLLDSGTYRNGTTPHAHNLITNDGRSPAELRAIARDELGAYDTVAVRDARVTAIERKADGFAVTLEEGDLLRARRVVLATGMHDELPDIPGTAEAWGREVAQCPFCHGHEFTGRALALIGEPPHVVFLQGMLARIASEVTVLGPGSVTRIDRVPEGLRLALRDGGILEVAGLFLGATPRQAAPFAETLGAVILPSGAVEVDANGRTGVPGLYAAGDMAQVPGQPGPLASLAASIASGQLAAVGVVRDALDNAE
jgi:thioredoxin reductase